MAYQELVTEDAMFDGVMSLLGSDQAMMNASVASVIYSASIGALETSNIVNADTIADEAFRADIEAKKKDNDIAIDLAQATSTGISEENLRKIRDGQVTYADGQYNIGGILVDEEDMDATVDDMVDNFDDVVARHNLDAEQAAVLMALLVEYQNTDDPELKAKILEEIGEVSPNVQNEMARKADMNAEYKHVAVRVEEASIPEKLEPLGHDDLLDHQSFTTAASPMEPFKLASSAQVEQKSLQENEVSVQKDIGFEFS